MQNLAEFAGLTTDLSPYIGNYAPEPRDISTDEMILEWRDRIKNPRLQWVYGVMAAFGLRPHEVFSCRFINPLALHVDKDTKTGSRTARAIRPEWAEQWDLTNINRPKTKNQGRASGQLVSRGFDRNGIPFQLYDLRHAWAIRASVVEGLSPTVAAKMVGHSVATHTRVYHKWLSDAGVEREYNAKILAKSNV